jgi:exonuclease III
MLHAPADKTVQELNQLYHNRLWDNLSSLSGRTINTTSGANGSLRILHHNIRSITKKIHFYQSFDLHRSCDIISVSETWLRPSIPNSLVSVEGFSLIRDDRKSATKSRGGGAAIYIKSDLKHTTLAEPSQLLSEYCDSSVWISINNHSGRLTKPTIVASIYLPPDSDKLAFIDKISQVLSHQQLVGKDVVILGDLNINWNISSLEKVLLEQALQPFGLQQRVQGVTFVSHLGKESLLDLNFVSNSLHVAKCTILTCDKVISDHYATYLVLQSKLTRKPRKLVETRNYKNFCPEQFYMDATSIPFLMISQDKSLSLHKKMENIDDEILRLLNSHAPLKTIRVRGAKNPWLSEGLLKLINEKNKFYKRVFQSSQSASDRQIQHYHKFKTFTLNQIRKAKKDYYASRLSKDTKSFYRCLQSLTGNSKTEHVIERLKIGDDETTVCRQTIAEVMNTFFTNIPGKIAGPSTKYEQPTPNTHSFKFVSVSEEEIRKLLLSLKPHKRGGPHQIPTFIYQYLANLLSLPLSLLLSESISTSVFPDCLKAALVTPIHKKGCQEDPNNYRPISSLPIISKVFESAIKAQLLNHLENANLLNTRQFGFRQHHSTEQLLQSLLQIWRTKLDGHKPCYISALSLDVKKAFDSVNHATLLRKLPNFMLSQSAIQLLSSYLKNRKQIMKIGQTKSTPLEITSGVPQGSILGPILFTMAINDLLSVFQSAFSYADDTVIFSVGDTVEDSISKSSSLLKKVSKWYFDNQLSLNLAKTQLCVFSNRPITHKPSITIGGSVIEVQDSLSILGVTLDPALTFSLHTKNIVSKANKLVYLSSKFRKFLNVEQAIKIFQTIIRPIMEYCSSLLLNTSVLNIRQIELTQNRAIRIILSAPRIFSVTTGRTLLNLPTLKSRRQYLFCKFIHSKLLKGRASRYLLELLAETTSHNHSLRSSHCVVKPYFRTNTGQAAFLNLIHNYLHRNMTNPSDLLAFSESK